MSRAPGPDARPAVRQLRAELLKQRATSTATGLLLGLIGLCLFISLLHGLILPAGQLDTRADQQTLFGWGTVLGTLFAALWGAVSITGELRHGTISSTFLCTPRRRRVIAAKVAASALAGLALGLIAEALTAGAGSAALLARGLQIHFDAAGYALLLAGGALGACACAAIGVAVGALVRNQVATLLGVSAWVLLVEPLLESSIPSVGRFAPGAAAGALAGATAAVSESRLLPAAVGAALLLLYAAALATSAAAATARRDVP